MKQEVQTTEVVAKDGKKTAIPLALFEKKVEMEYDFLVYLDNVPKKEALRKARASVSEDYEVIKRKDA